MQERETLLLKLLIGRDIMAYRIATVPMTLSDLQDHSRLQAFISGIFCTAVQRLTLNNNPTVSDLGLKVIRGQIKIKDCKGTQVICL